MAHSYFLKECDFKVDYAPATVKKWRSSRTGLQVALIDQASPVVNGYFAVATEILNDSGCPHTLEHLIFMGSKKYPYKGLLDILGNLAFSSTNAWTATDQTVYTLTTAGWDGFKMLLPIYLDHLFHPTITDAACYTEVYHVDGSGKEKGVVYSEMQGIENQSWFIQNLEAQRLLYKNSGYKSETGGLTKNLRTLEPETIRKYHADNYRPDNLCVIITGSIEEEELLNIMTEFDSELQSLPEIPNKRPFVDTPQDLPLTKSTVTDVLFPDKDESSGNVMISWIGPDSRNTIIDQAVDILGKYLTSSSVSLFDQEFVQIEDPLATSCSFYTENYIRSGITINFDNVPTDKLKFLTDKVVTLMKDHCDETKMDLVRLKDLIEQTKWKYVHNSEKKPDNIAYISIFEFEYGEESGKDLEKYAKTLNEFDELLTWDIKKWIEIYKQYFIDNHYAVVTATPSKELYKKNNAERSKILKERKEKLGEEGLKDLEKKLEEAQNTNNKKIPDDIINSFGKPNPSNIKFIKTESVAIGLNKDIENNKSSKIVADLIKDTPDDFSKYVHIENYESSFATISALFSSYEIDSNLLPLLKVFETLTTLPVLNDNEELTPYEDVVKQLKRDTISCQFSNSFNGRFDEFMTLSMTVKNADYQKAVEWFEKLLFKTKFTKERVTVALNRLIKTLPELKRSGSYMLRYLYSKHMYSDRSLMKSSDIFTNADYLQELLDKIENGEFETIEKQLEQIRTQLFHSSNMRLIIFGDTSKIEAPISSWKNFHNKSSENKKLTDLPYQRLTLSELGKTKSDKCFIITTPGSDSSYLNLMTSIPIGDYTSDDTFKIALGAAYLQCVEGPFWRGIRGAGLAYGANCHNASNTGELYFSIYRGADVEKCYTVAKDIVCGFATGKTPIDDNLRQGAVCSIVNALAETQSYTSAAAVAQVYDDVLVKRGPNYNNKLMKALSEITNQDLVEIFSKYFVNLFDPKKSACFISCNPSNATGIENFFKSLKYDVSVENISVDSNEGQDEGSDEESEEYSEDGSEDGSEEYSEDESEESETDSGAEL